jgi:hypothetical protein
MPAGAASFLPDLADWTHGRTDTIDARNPTRGCTEKGTREREREREREEEDYATKRYATKRERERG